MEKIKKSKFVEQNAVSGFADIVNLNGDHVLIPKERLTREFATQQLETHYAKERVFAMAGILVYPCNSDNKNYVHLAWRGSIVDKRQILPVGFYDVILGTFIDVPCTFCFIPFSNLSSSIGGARFTVDGEGTICMVSGKFD